MGRHGGARIGCIQDLLKIAVDDAPHGLQEELLLGAEGAMDEGDVDADIRSDIAKGGCLVRMPGKSNDCSVKNALARETRRSLDHCLLDHGTLQELGLLHKEANISLPFVNAR